MFSGSINSLRSNSILTPAKIRNRRRRKAPSRNVWTSAAPAAIIAPRMTSAPRMPQTQHAMLERRRHPERRENERDDEHVVERERNFDEIAGGECLGVLAAAPVRQAGGKQHRQPKPNRRATQSLTELDRVGAA